ncbi:MAG: hypothetical protein B6244_08185 [Candidatus Cloacimonetes bacterium 4572_55]|nr:MAG: hypothetical protein B6244_08185 [Candidatus Cloacimonetes bacterium 4572_55]
MFHILFDSESKFLFTAGRFLQDITEIRPNLKKLKYVISMDVEEAYQEDAMFWDDFLEKGKRLLESGADAYQKQNVSEDHVAAILYTSGTTGQSKGVMLTQKNIISDVKGVPSRVTFDPEDNFISILPLHHSFEATAGFITPICTGCTITYSPSLKSKEIVGTIREKRCTIMLGVPLLFEKMGLGIKRKINQAPFTKRTLFYTSMRIVKTARTLFGKRIGKKVFAGMRKKAGLESVKLMVSGGAALTPEVGQFFQDLGFDITQGYGLTETSPVISVNPVEKVKMDSVGLPFPSVTVKIDQPTEEGVGEVVVKGPIVMKGYYKNPDATAEILRDGWFFTGDLGRIDEEGYLYITGRCKNLIVTKAGKNVYPEEVEFALLKSPFILEALIVGRMVGDREVVQAIVVPDTEYFDTHAKENNISLDEKKVKEMLKVEIAKYCEKLADYKRVRNFEIRDEEFPKTSKKSIKRYLFQSKSVKV